MPEPHFLIIGAGPAGGTAAKTLRDEGFAGRITLVGREAHRPYIRPPLSKQYLRGEVSRESVFLEDAAWYAENDVNLLSGVTIAAIDVSGHRVRADDGWWFDYDTLLLATGSTPRRPDIEGADLPGVHYLRTIDDSESLHADLATGGKRLVLIGSGFIGMEVAASARLLGNEVTILERGPIPLSHAIGDDLGAFFADEQSRHGNTLRPSVEIQAVLAASGTVSGVRLADGEIIPADVVLVGAGATPNVALAEAAGIEVDNGVLADERLATSAPDVYAAGDLANAFHPTAQVRIRNEHFSNALKGGKAAAKAMLGQDARFDDLPTFVSEQFDITLQFAGFAPLMPGARLVRRGDAQSRSFSAFWLADGRAVAGVNINVPDPDKSMQALIRSARQVDPAQLADPGIPLDQL